ncbi:MAG: hypothetical protein JOY78_19305 [Pseudonocardia sp.]|nr:hypothetical protein [Pseudonocardia sp.]
MTQRSQESAEAPSDTPVSPGRPVRVLALASVVLAVVFALLGFLGAVAATEVAGALVLGGGLLAGTAALPRAARVAAPAAVVATVGVVGLLQEVAASRGGSTLLLAAVAVAVLVWITAVAVAVVDAGFAGSPAAPVVAVPAAPPVAAPAWAPVPGWQPSAYPADPTMTYVGQQPTGQQAVAAPPESTRAPEPAAATVVFGGAGQASPEQAPVFGQASSVGAPDSTTVFGQPPSAAASESGSPQPTAVIDGPSPQNESPESPAAVPQYGLSATQPSTGVHRAPAQDAGLPPAADVPLFKRSQHEPIPFGVVVQPGSQQTPDVPLFGVSGVAQPAASKTPAIGHADTGQAATSAHHEPVRDASPFSRTPSGDSPSFGVAGLGQAKSAHHEPVQDASVYDPSQPRPVYGAAPTDRDQDPAAGRPPSSGLHRAPTQDSIPLFGALPSGRAVRNGSAPAGVVYGAQPGGNEAQGYGLFAGSSGAHRAPSDTGATPNGRPGAPVGGTDNAATHGANGTSYDSGMPSQRAGNEASGPSYQQAGRGRRRAAEGSAPVFGAPGAPPGGDPAQPQYGRAGGSENSTARSAEARPADQDSDPSPETTAFPVQPPPQPDPVRPWGQPPPVDQDATMVAAPGWLGAGQPGSEGAAPAGPRRAAREGRHGTPDDGRHGQPDATRVFPPPER